MKGKRKRGEEEKMRIGKRRYDWERKGRIEQKKIRRREEYSIR